MGPAVLQCIVMYCNNVELNFVLRLLIYVSCIALFYNTCLLYAVGHYKVEKHTSENNNVKQNGPKCYSVVILSLYHKTGVCSRQTYYTVLTLYWSLSPDHYPSGYS